MRLDHLLSKEEEVEKSVSLLSFQAQTLPVSMRSGVTPVPIPNTMVKTWEADDTMLETAWESRWLPESLLKRPGKRKAYQIKQASGDHDGC